MKKNVMLKIAAVLLVAVLLTTCAISSTFAKYVTEYTSTAETARVAKWGLEVDTTSVASQKLFHSKYMNGNGVTATTGDMIMAPGTEGSISLSSLVKGTAEVSAQVQIYVSYVANGFMVDGGSYNPVVVKVNDTAIFPNEQGTWQTVGDPIIVLANKTVDAADTNLKIEWKWAFDGENAKDTKLGQNGAQNTISIQYKIEIMQTADAAERA